MRKKRLTDVCNITTGKLDANAAVEDGEYPFFTCAPAPSRIDTYAYEGDVILLAGNNAQGNFHINRFNGKFNAYQRTYIITAKDGYDIDFIKYALELSLKNLKNQAQGSQTKFLTMQILNDFMVDDISYNQQVELIASIKEIDRKISNNDRLIDKLDDYGRTLYDYWFMQFDFPNDERRPYRQSGGSMKKSRKLKKDIPVDWEEGKLSDIAMIVMGQSPKGSSYNEEKDGMIFFQGSTDFGKKYPMERVYTTEPTRFAEAGDILMSVRAPVGTLNYAMEKCCIGRGLAAIRSKSGSNLYLYYVLEYFGKLFEIMNGNGTTFGSIGKDELHGLEIAIPPEKIIEQFNEKVMNIETKIKQAELENRKLNEIRDLLLPMLMNGQAGIKKHN